MTRFLARSAFVFLMMFATLAGYAMLAPPPERGTPPSYAQLLDGAVLSQGLCGEKGRNRASFFRQDFHDALIGSARAAAPGTVEDKVPLYDDLGDYSFKITTRNAEAQAYFNQGLRLGYAYNHWEAARAYRQAQKADPTCAMCYWGEALVLGMHINDVVMNPAHKEPAFAAAAKALALSENASDIEKALIGALIKRYSADPNADQGPLDQAYAAAMTKVYKKHGTNNDVATLYAEAHMDVTPWDYWERDLKTPHPIMAEPIKAVEAVLKRNPNHPGAIHLYIHLTEATPDANKAEPFADKLADLMPGAGHLVHMPGHTYFRIGRYIDALNTNIVAVDVDERYLASIQGSDVYRYGYYPHNVHFVLAAAQMAGDPDTALAFSKKLDALIPYDAVQTQPWISPIKAAPLYGYLQFGTVEDVMALAKPPADVPYVVANWHYVRGIILAQDGQADAAKAEAQAIRDLRANTDLSSLEDFGVPAGTVMDLAAKLIEARIAQTGRDYDSAASLLHEAVALQNTINYTEPPYWYYPVEQTLGAVLLQAGKPKEAAEAFFGALLSHPNNAWSLYGLMKAQQAAGDASAPETAELYKKASVKQQEIPLDRL